MKNKFFKLNIFRPVLFMALCCSFFGLTSCKKEENNGNSYALFIYMSGADLEEGAGAGSQVIDELLKNKPKDNVSVYLETGGTHSWKNKDISDGKVMLYQIKDGALIELADKGLCNMGEKDTFSDFVDFTNTVRADRKVLMFWGHGSPYGICTDSLHGNDKLCYDEIQEGFGESYFDLIIFNACYTANLDLMTFISGNADYAIASEEVFPSLGYDYSSMLDLFSDDAGVTMADAAKKIIDDTVKRYSESSIKDTLTLSLFDLVKISVIKDSVEDYMSNIAVYSDEWMKDVSTAGNIGSVGKDIFDIQWDDGLIANMMSNSLLYETHGTGFAAEGMYIFYKEKMTEYDLDMYSPNCAYKDYLFLLKHKKDMSDGSYIKFITSLPDKDYVCNTMLDDTAVKYAAYFGYVCYDGAGNRLYEDVAGLTESYIDGSGRTSVAVDKNALFSLRLCDIPLEYSVDSIQSDETSDARKIIYSFPANINDKEGKIVFSYSYSEIPDAAGGGWNTGSYDIVGFQEKNGEDEGFLEELKPGDKITINGENTVYEGETITKIPHTEAKSIAIMVCDIYGKEYYSDMTELAVDFFH